MTTMTNEGLNYAYFMTNLAEVVATQHSGLRSARTTVTDLENALAAQSEELKAAKGNLARSRSYVKQLQRRIDQRGQEFGQYERAMEAKCAALKEENETLLTKCAAERERDEYKNKLANAEGVITELKRRLERRGTPMPEPGEPEWRCWDSGTVLTRNGVIGQLVWDTDNAFYRVVVKNEHVFGAASKETIFVDGWRRIVPPWAHGDFLQRKGDEVPSYVVLTALSDGKLFAQKTLMSVAGPVVMGLDTALLEGFSLYCEE